MNLLLVMSLLQRPSVPYAVEYAGKKSSISNDLKGGLAAVVRRRPMETDVHSWSCHYQVLNERASGKCLGGQIQHEECEILINRKVLR